MAKVQPLKSEKSIRERERENRKREDRKERGQKRGRVGGREKRDRKGGGKERRKGEREERKREGKLFLKVVCQLTNITGMTELEYQHFATIVAISELAKYCQRMLLTLHENWMKNRILNSLKIVYLNYLITKAKIKT